MRYYGAMSETVVTFAQAVDAVKASLDVVTVVSSTVTLRKAGRNYTGLCPFHKEKSPSFSVNREKNLFKCFGCGEAGDAITFLMKTSNKGFADVIREEAERQGLTIATQHTQTPTHTPDEKAKLAKLHTLAADWFTNQLTLPVHAYLQQRQIPPQWIRHFGLGYAPNQWDGLRAHLGQLMPDVTDKQLVEAGLCVQKEDRPGSYDRFRDRLMIPIYNDQGHIVAFGGRGLDHNTQPKYLNSPESPLYTKSRLLYGLNWAKTAIKERRRALIMEGYFDVMRAHMAGFTEAVATCGTAMTREHVTLLLRNGVDTLYLAFDQDAAGQRAALSALDLLDSLPAAHSLKLKVVQIPNGKDPDDYLASHPAEAFEALMTEAMSHWQFRCQAAIAGLDLQQLDDRVTATNQLMAVLQQCQHPVLRTEYARQYAPLLGITEQDLLQHTRQNAPQVGVAGGYDQRLSDKGQPVVRRLDRKRRHADVSVLQHGLTPQHQLAERVFFKALLASNALFTALHPALVTLPWVTEGAKQLAEVLAFEAPTSPVEDVNRQLLHTMQTNAPLRHYLTDVWLTAPSDIAEDATTTSVLEKKPDALTPEEWPLLVATVQTVLTQAQRRLKAKQLTQQIMAAQATPGPQSPTQPNTELHPLELQYSLQEVLTLIPPNGVTNPAEAPNNST
jgi:DNA primase